MNKLFALAISLVVSGVLAGAQAVPAPAQKKEPPKRTQTSSHAAVEAPKLNPQPLPPGAQKGTTAQTLKPSSGELNPQPLPPGRKMNQSTSSASRVTLNPQPLPPGRAKAASGASKVEKVK